MRTTGTVVVYLVCGYVALVLLSSLFLVGPGGLSALVLLAVGAGVWLARRARATEVEAGDASDPVELPPVSPASPVPPTSAALLRRRVDALAQDFPETAAESPLLLGVADLYDHEPLEERDRLESEYEAQRRRLTDCGAALDAGEPAERLLPDVEKVERYADGLRALASRAGDDPVAAALEATGHAADAVAEGRAALVGVEGSDRDDLSAALEAAEDKLRAARAAFPEGAERPLLALRLADEAERTAADVRKRAQRLGGLPAQLDRRFEEFDRAVQRLGLELGRVKEEFLTASEHYAPSCWADVRGIGASAQQAAERARRYRSAAAAKAQRSPAEAKAELDEAFRALDRAHTLARTISDHLARLETASLTARDTVASAEEAVEEAAAAGGDGDHATAGRAAKLVEEARAELGRPQPDWLRVVELARRARELVLGEAQPTPPAPTSAELTTALETARAGAKDARDSAWAYGLVSPEVEATAKPMLDEVEGLYAAAVEADAEARAGGADRLQAAVDAYRAAEQRARSAGEQIADIYAESIARRSRRLARELPKGEAERLVWGGSIVFGTPPDRVD